VSAYEEDLMAAVIIVTSPSYDKDTTR